MSVAPIVVLGSASIKCVGLYIVIGDRREWGIILSILQLAPLSPYYFPPPE